MEEMCATLAECIPEITELEKVDKDLILQVKVKIEDKMQQKMKKKEKLIGLQEDIKKTKLNGKAEVFPL